MKLGQKKCDLYQTPLATCSVGIKANSASYLPSRTKISSATLILALLHTSVVTMVNHSVAEQKLRFSLADIQSRKLQIFADLSWGPHINDVASKTKKQLDGLYYRFHSTSPGV